MRKTYERLIARGVSLNMVVDGGAFVGEWTKRFKRFFPETRVLMVEPQPRHRETLEGVASELGDSIIFVPALLGAEPREAVPFFVHDDEHGGSGSSVLPENSNVLYHVIELPMTTLDAIFSELQLPAPDLIKLDVQGYELEVLNGARTLLESTEFVLLEVAVWQYNIGAPLLQEVLNRMDHLGFVPYDLAGIHRLHDHTLNHLDILFVKRGSTLAECEPIVYHRLSKDQGAMKQAEG